MPPNDDDHAPYVPTPEQIEAECRAIRAKRTKKFHTKLDRYDAASATYEKRRHTVGCFDGRVRRGVRVDE